MKQLATPQSQPTSHCSFLLRIWRNDVGDCVGDDDRYTFELHMIGTDECIGFHSQAALAQFLEDQTHD